MDFNPGECVAIKSGDKIWYLRRWPYGIGSWVSDLRGKLILPRVLAAPIFNRFGRPEFGLSVQDSEQRRINFERIEQWLDEIPDKLKSRAFADLGRFQLTALEACQQNTNFAHFVEQEHRRANGNFIVAAWVLHRQLAQPTEYRQTFNRRLASEKRAHILRALMESKIPPLYLKLLYRCDDSALDEEALWVLLAGCKHKTFGQALADVSTISSPGLEIAWHDLPEWLHHSRILQCLMQLPEETRSLSTVIPPAMLDAQGPQRRRILQSLRTAQNLEDLEDRLHKLSLAFKLTKPLPKPPFVGTKQLFAVTTGKQLESEGKYMHNCVAGYAESIANGRHYFYHFAGKEQATVLLKRDGFYDWVVAEHLGISNSQLAEATLVEIYRELAKFESAGYPLYLDKARVAGFYYRKTPDLWRRLRQEEGCKLRLIGEPENVYDPLAVAVYFRGEHLGYVPRSQNRIISLLLRQGLSLRANILQVRGEFENAELLVGIVATG